MMDWPEYKSLIREILDLFPGAVVKEHWGPGDGRKRWYFAALDEAKSRGHKLGSVYYRYREKFKSIPDRQWLDDWRSSRRAG